MPNVETFLSMSLSPERAKGKEYKPMPYTSSRSKGSLFGLVLFARAYGDLHVRASPTSAQDQDLPPALTVVLASWSGEKCKLLHRKLGDFGLAVSALHPAAVTTL